MESWKSLIPWGLLAPFLIIIFIEFGLGYALNFYNQKLYQDILNLKSRIEQKEKSLEGGLGANTYFKVFSQAVNIVEILRNKKSLGVILNRFNELMPKFLIIKELSYDADKNEIEIVASTQNWQDYIRFYKYVTHLENLELKSFTSPELDENNNLINFSMVLFLKPSFYQ